MKTKGMDQSTSDGTIMLASTFCHIPGISEKTEQALWSLGVRSWGSPLPTIGLNLPQSTRDIWKEHIHESISHQQNLTPDYFAAKLPSKELWRLFYDFQQVAAFLDIETTGLFGGDITTIALYDGVSIKHYVNGINLHEFPGDILNYRLLITYNGRSFDIPYIETYFGIKLPHAHIDLRYPLRSLGLQGGLKGCEKLLGINRDELNDVNGFDAVLLWNEYRKKGNPEVLNTLLAYNIQDTIVLHTLMVHTHNEKIKVTPFANTYSMRKPILPEIPFKADFNLVRKVRMGSTGF